jgi:hypothetical protein
LGWLGRVPLVVSLLVSEKTYPQTPKSPKAKQTYRRIQARTLMPSTTNGVRSVPGR